MPSENSPSVAKYLLAQKAVHRDRTSLRTGEVTGVNDDGTVTLLLQGTTLTNVPYLVGFLPVVGDIVWTLVQQGSIGVLGRKANSADDTGGGASAPTDTVWKFGGTANGTDPGAGYMRIAGTGSNPRTFNINKTDADGVERNLAPMTIGDVFIITDDPSAPPITGFARYVIDTDVIDHGTWVSFQALRTDTNGSTNVPPVETRLRFLAYLQAPAADNGDGSPVGGHYTWSDQTVMADPGSGVMRANSGQLMDASELALSKVDSTGMVVEGYGIFPGDILFLTNESRTWGTVVDVTTVGVQGTWFKLGIKFDRGSNPNPPEGEPVLVQWVPQNTTPEDHDHDKYLTPEEVLPGTGIVVDRPGDGTVEISAAQAGTANARYKFSQEVTGAPAVGYLRLNTSDQINAGEMVLNDVDANGVNWSWAWGGLTVGDEFMLKDAAGDFYRGYIDGPVSDIGGIASFPVVMFIGEGQLSQDELIDVRVYLGSADSIDHGNLGGLGDDDHPQYAKTTDPGLEEVYFQPTPPTPSKAAVWVDSDGATGVAPIVSAIPVGGVIHHAGSQVPPEWLLCDGRAVSRSTYAVLYSIIGTTYGSGNGSSTFNLPNLITTFLRGQSSPGGRGGSATHSHPGTDWRTGSGGSHDHGGNTGSRNIGHDHTINTNSHNHGGTGSSSSGGSIGSAGGHNHGGQTGTYTWSSLTNKNGPDGTVPSHRHSISSDGSHSHSLSGTSHSHSISGNDHNHSGTTGNSNPSHDHGVPNHNGHDHNIPASTSEGNLPPYLNMLPLIYAGV